MIPAWTLACLVIGVSPEYRSLEKGVGRENLARTDKGVRWSASDGVPPKYDAAQVLDGQACDAGGGDGYWAGSRWQMPVTLELTFARPETFDTQAIIWYTPDIRGVDYGLEGLTPEGQWVELYQARGNRYRDVIYRFAPRTVAKVRFTLRSAAGQNRMVMREFLLFNGLAADDAKTLMNNAARCLGPNDRSRMTDLGIAVKAVTYANSQAVVGPGPGNGKPAFYTSYYNTGGAELLAYEPAIKKVSRYPISGASGGYGLTAGLDGKLYIGTVGSGHLIQFDPKSEKLRDLGNAGQPTQYIWGCATGPDGKVFGAGYPRCIPLIYDPRTDTLSSPGSISPKAGTDYLRYVTTDPKGRAWFGVGTKAGIMVFDPADGSFRDILPKEFADQSTAYHLVRAGERIYVSLIFSGQVLVFDANSCALIRQIPPPPGESTLMVSVADSAGNVYANGSPSQHLYVIRPEAAKAVQIREYLGSVKAILDDRYLLAFFDNDARILDLKTSQIVDERRWIEPFEGMAIFTLTQGPDGRIYGSTYINQHFFRYDPDANRLEDLGLIIRAGGQCDSIACSRDGKRLWMGCYAGAYLSVYDPTRPHKLGTEPRCNPRDFGRLDPGQYRTCATVEGPDGRIYVGSIPSYNSSPTGALTIFDEKTLTKKVRTDLVPNGAVSCLAANDRFVYGSGGGRLFAWNPGTDTKARERDLACSAVTVARDGSLVVSAAGSVQGLDPMTLATRWSIPLASIKNLKALHRLVTGPKGELYGISELGIVRVDSKSGTLTQLTQLGSTHLAVDNKGRLYFSQGANLYAYDPPSR
jgi:streptogramin lyase